MPDYISIAQAFVGLYGVYLSLGLICFITLCILTIFLVSILTKNPLTIGLGFFKINFGSKYNNSSTSKNLIESLLEYQDDFTRKIVNIENNTLRRQLNYSEQKLSQLKYLMTNSYSALLASKLQVHEDVKLHKDYRSYQILISMLIKDLIDNVLKEALIENHLDEMSSKEWESYISDKTNYILNYTEDFLDNLYSDGKMVLRNESYEAERKLFPEMKALFTEIFDTVKEIGIQAKKEIKNCRDISQIEVKEICKSNGLLLEE
jgi:hypothetical protein